MFVWRHPFCSSDYRVWNRLQKSSAKKRQLVPIWTQVRTLLLCWTACGWWGISSLHGHFPSLEYIQYPVSIQYPYSTVHTSIHTVQHSTAQHSTAQHSTAQYSTAQHSTAQHSTVQYSKVQHSTAQYSTAQHSTAQHSTAQHSTVQHSTVQYSTVKSTLHTLH